MLLRITFLTLCYSSLNHCQLITVNGLTPKPANPSIDKASNTESTRPDVRTTLASPVVKQKWTLPAEDDEVSGCSCTCEVRKGKKPASNGGESTHQSYKGLVSNDEEATSKIETSTIRFHFSASATSLISTTTQEAITIPATTVSTSTIRTTEEPLAAINNIVETTTAPSIDQCTPETTLHICKAFVLAVNHTGPLGSCILFNKDFLLRQFESCITNLCPRKLQACGSIQQIVQACEIVSLDTKLTEWFALTGCEEAAKHCPDHSSYQDCARCQPACEPIDQRAAHFCAAGPCQAGCVCDDGFVADRSDGDFRCARKADCTCKDAQGIARAANSTWLSNKCTRENVCNEGVIRSRATSCRGNQSCFEVGPQTEECASQAPAGHASLATGRGAVRHQQEVNWEPFGRSEDGRTNWEKWEQRYREIVGRSKQDKHA